METRNNSRVFLFLANPFLNGSVIACSAAEIGAAMMPKRVITQYFLNWFSQDRLVAFYFYVELTVTSPD